MKRRTILLAVAMASLITTAAAAQVREQNPNLVGGELMGRGLIVTLNYERFLTNAFGVGGGLMAIGTSDGSGVLVPLYLSVATGDVHSLYLSGGTTYVGGGDTNDYEDTWLVTASVGYQYHSYGGFFVRPLFTLFLPTEDSDEFLIWPGITIGGSF
jgi:hypothetical protein